MAASRCTTGNHALYLELEKQSAKFFGAEAAVLVSTGYVTNLAVAQTLAGEFSHVLLDNSTHVAQADAANLFNCPVLKFKHRDVADFKRNLKRCGRGARPVVLTDGLFSYEGAVAPLRAYLKLLPRDGLVVVDDAHGAGTIGANGRGAVEVEGVSRERIVQCITFSKAFGVYGGAILSSKKLRNKIVERSPLFKGSTPLPLPLVNAAIASLALVKKDRSLRTRLNRNANWAKDELRKTGFPLPDNPGPIIPFVVPVARIAALRKALLNAGIYPSFIRYGNGPATGYFRFVISSEHTQAQLRSLTETLKRFV